MIRLTDFEVIEEKVRWTCLECGSTHIQNGRSDLYCVCGDGRVARTSDEWKDIRTVILEDVLAWLEDHQRRASKDYGQAANQGTGVEQSFEAGYSSAIDKIVEDIKEKAGKGGS